MQFFSTQVVVETSFFLFIRLALFLACSKYLLRNLYHDLQCLNEPTAAGAARISYDADGIELENLPEPASATKRTTFPDKRPLHSSISRGLFSLCFTECCIMFLLLMCQGLEMFDARTRVLNWHFSLFVLLAAILLLVPLSCSFVLTYPSSTGLQRPTIIRTIITIIPVCLYLLLLSYIPLPPALSSSPEAPTLSRLAVLGTIILGLLSGFGAINNAWSFFPLFSRTPRHQPSADDILAAEQGLTRVRNDLTQRRLEIERMEAAQPKTGSTWLSNVVPNFRGETQMTSIAQEVQGLEALEYEMSRSLESLRQRRAHAAFSQTLVGKLFNVGGRLFAVYCLYRIVVSISNLLIPMRSKDKTATQRTDWVTLFLAYALSALPSVSMSTDTIAMISRQISLALVGVIILSSIRMVLRGVARALRVTSRNLGASFMLLILAQLMGIYLLATLIQLRTSFPPPPARPDTGSDDEVVNLFSTLPEFQVFGSLFDGSFLIAASVSAAVRWFNDKINGVTDTL